MIFLDFSRLTKKYLDSEIALMRANDRIKFLEQELTKKLVDIMVAKKEAKQWKTQHEKCIKLPKIHSESLRVSLSFCYFIYIERN